MKIFDNPTKSNSSKVNSGNEGKRNQPVQRAERSDEHISVLDKIDNSSTMSVAQKKSNPEDEELMQGKFETAQRKVVPEKEELLQGKFEIVQRKEPEEEEPLQGKFTSGPAILQKQEQAAPPRNNTGLSDQLKAGIENLSGYSLDDVKVHYNSPKPANLQAHAYAQGTDIHLASGQEKHLPHEAWHVVQQKQGRVKPTMQMKGKVNVNDDEGLEKEADEMGAMALADKNYEKNANSAKGLLDAHLDSGRDSACVVQPRLLFKDTWYRKGDDAVLNQKGEGKLPIWTKIQLESEEIFYALNANQTEWVKDTELNFMRFKGGKKTGGAKTGASSPKPLADVGFGSTDANRVGPKHPENRMVSKVRLFKYSDEREGHWMLQCEVDGGKSGKKDMKIDLTADSYRIMYGATQAPTNVSKHIDFELNGPTPVENVYKEFVQIAKEKGVWTGTDKYNCQDFALAMLNALKVQQLQKTDLEEQERWREGQK